MHLLAVSACSGTVTLSDYQDQAKSQMVWDSAAPGTQVGGKGFMRGMMAGGLDACSSCSVGGKGSLDCLPGHG
jgi:hypothetical protein